MSTWHVLELISGLCCIALGIFNKEFTPIGLSTKLIWGSGQNARVPRWLAGPFYVALGLLAVYLAVTRK